MFAILGEIEFELLGGLTGMDYRSTADWAEHQLIQGKPLLEWIGEGLDEYSLAITLHASLGDPEKRLRDLREAKAAHQPLAFVLGSGDYLGAFVLTELSNNVRRTTALGRLHSATLTVTLREYTGTFTRKPRRLGLLDPSSLASSSPGLLSRAISVPSTAQQVLGYARSAGNILQSGASLYQAVRNGSPLSALNQLPQLLGMTGRALAPLQGLSSLAGLLDGGAELAALGDNMLGSVNGALASLTAVDMSSVSSVFGSLGSINLDGMSSALADLSAVDLGRVTSALASLGSATLEGVTGALAGLTVPGINGVIDEFGALASGDFSSVTGALASVRAVDLGNVLARVDASATQVGHALDALDGASTKLSSLAAAVITRKV
jgi:phage protein U